MTNIINTLLPKKAQAPDIYRPKRKLAAAPIILEAASPIVLKNNKKTQVSEPDLGITDLKTSRTLHK